MSCADWSVTSVGLGREIRVNKPVGSTKAQILEFLAKREDIWLDEGVRRTEAPTIVGIQLKRVKETEVRGPESYHPFNYVGWKYYGQSFAIELNFSKHSKPILSPEQEEWRDEFEGHGGIYIMPRAMSDIYEHLGTHCPQPWDEYLERSTRVGPLGGVKK